MNIFHFLKTFYLCDIYFRKCLFFFSVLKFWSLPNLFAFAYIWNVQQPLLWAQILIIN